jgi:hypothetical protein
LQEPACSKDIGGRKLQLQPSRLSRGREFESTAVEAQVIGEMNRPVIEAVLPGQDVPLVLDAQAMEFTVERRDVGSGQPFNNATSTTIARLGYRYDC